MMIFYLFKILHPVLVLAAIAPEHHMDMPEGGIFFYLVLIVSGIIVVAVTIWTVKLIFWPGEKSGDHIKYKILED